MFLLCENYTHVFKHANFNNDIYKIQNILSKFVSVMQVGLTIAVRIRTDHITSH
jgi:hypothetical protein